MFFEKLFWIKYVHLVSDFTEMFPFHEVRVKILM